MAPPPPRRRGFGRFVLTLVLLVLIAAAIAVGWFAWRGGIGTLLPVFVGKGADKALIMDATKAPPPPPAPDAPGASSPLAAAPAGLATLGTVETRLALLEERLSRLDLQAEAASGNAARAEGLLIAFAARRALDRGAPLGYLEDQLKLRFGDAQPNAVKVIVDASHAPVTLDELASGLDAAAPALARTAPKGDAWSVVRNEIADLFIVRREAAHGQTAEQRLDRAQLLLASGKTEQAITLVESMPGRAEAAKWLASARRYADARRALDLIETAAILEPRALSDGEGRKVKVPSPLAAPVLVEPEVKTD